MLGSPSKFQTLMTNIPHILAFFSAKSLRILAGSCFSISLLSQEQLMTNTRILLQVSRHVLTGGRGRQNIEPKVWPNDLTLTRLKYISPIYCFTLAHSSLQVDLVLSATKNVFRNFDN